MELMALSTKALIPYFNSFPLFCSLVWQAIGLPQTTPIQVDIAKTLQHPPNDRFILIGFESSRGVIGEDLPTEKMSINMLTGKIISYNRQDQKETISKLPNRVEVLFSEFFPEGVNLFK